MVACGVSAISAVGNSYCQNEKSLERYYASLDQGVLPVARGLALSADDLVRRDVIGRLMCDFSLNVSAVERAHGIAFDVYFAKELARLREFEADGLIDLSDVALGVTPKGRLLVRNLCMVFDKYFGSTNDIVLQRMRYSKTI